MFIDILMLIIFSIISTALIIKFKDQISKKLKIIDHPTEKEKYIIYPHH